MSTITITIDTDHLDRQAAADISDILNRSVHPAEVESVGARQSYPIAVELGEALEGSMGGTVARFGFDKNKPKL